MNTRAVVFLHRLLVCIGLFLTAPCLSAQTFSELVLVDADSNQDIRVLGNGGVVNLAADGTALNIRADVNGSVGSVKFSLTGQEASAQTESVAPYALKGDSSGNYNSWLPAIGSYSLLVELFSGSGATGSLLDSETVAFTVINQADMRLYRAKNDGRNRVVAT